MVGGGEPCGWDSGCSVFQLRCRSSVERRCRANPAYHCMVLFDQAAREYKLVETTTVYSCSSSPRRLCEYSYPLICPVLISHQPTFHSEPDIP